MCYYALTKSCGNDCDFIDHSRPFSPSVDPGNGDGWSTDGLFCTLGGVLQCGIHLHRLISHREALGIADGDELSIFPLKIANDSPSGLSGVLCGGARVSPNNSFKSPDDKLHFGI